MRHFEIDAEYLINLVKERPALWDKTTEDYKARVNTTGLWREVCIELDKEFEWMSESEKSETTTNVIKKWRNIKDYWQKARKLELNCTDPLRKKRKYQYAYQLRFLLKIADDKGTSPDILPVETPIEPPVEPPLEETNNPPRIRQISPDRTPTTRSSNITRTPYNPDEFRVLQETPMNRHLSFFKGIMPSLQGFTEEETLEFQMGVLNTVQNIRRARLQQGGVFLNATSTRTQDSPNSDNTEICELKTEDYSVT